MAALLGRREWIALATTTATSPIVGGGVTDGGSDRVTDMPDLAAISDGLSATAKLAAGVDHIPSSIRDTANVRFW